MGPLGPVDPPLPTGASSSPYEAIIPPLLSLPDDYGQYQDLLRHVVSALNLPEEDVKDLRDEFLDILQPIGPSWVALPIHNTILQPAQVIWHAPASCTPIPKHSERHYFVPAKNSDFLFLHPPPNSMVVQAAI